MGKKCEKMQFWPTNFNFFQKTMRSLESAGYDE